jgi:hypothetical protein
LEDSVSVQVSDCKSAQCIRREMQKGATLRNRVPQIKLIDVFPARAIPSSRRELSKAL